MKIQQVSGHKYYCNPKQQINCKKSNLQTKTTAFKGNYEQVMEDVIRKDLKTRGDVEKAMSNLFFALTKENGITKTWVYPMLSEWLGLKGTYLIEELCKPIAKVRSEFRDIVFKSQEELLPIIKKGDDSLLYILNCGKHGFWNYMFDNESATNDMRIVFTSDDGMFEVGTTKKGKLFSEQSRQNGYWEKNTYYWFSGDRITHKTGDASEPVIWTGP